MCEIVRQKMISLGICKCIKQEANISKRFIFEKSSKKKIKLRRTQICTIGNCKKNAYMYAQSGYQDCIRSAEYKDISILMLECVSSKIFIKAEVFYG